MFSRVFIKPPLYFFNVVQLHFLLHLDTLFDLIHIEKAFQLLFVELGDNLTKNFDVLNQNVAVVLGLNVLDKLVVAVLDDLDERVNKHLYLDRLALLHHTTHKFF